MRKKLNDKWYTYYEGMSKRLFTLTLCFAKRDLPPVLKKGEIGIILAIGTRRLYYNDSSSSVPTKWDHILINLKDLDLINKVTKADYILSGVQFKNMNRYDPCIGVIYDTGCNESVDVVKNHLNNVITMLNNTTIPTI